MRRFCRLKISENIWRIFVRRRIRRGCYNLGDESTRLGHVENHCFGSAGSNHSTSVVIAGIFGGEGCAPGEIFCVGAGWNEPRRGEDAGGTDREGRSHESCDRGIPIRNFGVTRLPVPGPSSSLPDVTSAALVVTTPVVLFSGCAHLISG